MFLLEPDLSASFRSKVGLEDASDFEDVDDEIMDDLQGHLEAVDATSVQIEQIMVAVKRASEPGITPGEPADQVTGQMTVKPTDQMTDRPID